MVSVSVWGPANAANGEDMPTKIQDLPQLTLYTKIHIIYNHIHIYCIYYYMYVYVYIYIDIYIYIICVYIYMYVCMYDYVCIYIRNYICGKPNTKPFPKATSGCCFYHPQNGRMTTALL